MPEKIDLRRSDARRTDVLRSAQTGNSYGYYGINLSLSTEISRS
jgi:hypothetical protein